MKILCGDWCGKGFWKHCVLYFYKTKKRRKYGLSMYARHRMLKVWLAARQKWHLYNLQALRWRGGAVHGACTDWLRLESRSGSFSSSGRNAVKCYSFLSEECNRNICKYKKKGSSLSLKFSELVKNFYVQCELSLPGLQFSSLDFFVTQKQIPQWKKSSSYIVVVCRARCKFLYDLWFGFKTKTLHPLLSMYFLWLLKW